MAASSLLNEYVEQGRNTISVLDAAGLDVQAAFWIFEEDAQSWHFTIAEPTVDVAGTRALYERVERALRGQTDVLPIHEIYAVSPEDQLVALVRRDARTPLAGPGGARVRDLYVYRMATPPIRATAP